MVCGGDMIYYNYIYLPYYDHVIYDRYVNVQATEQRAHVFSSWWFRHLSSRSPRACPRFASRCTWQCGSGLPSCARDGDGGFPRVVRWKLQ